jgi:RNA polymerase sigma-70 factor (ECF subfamily)
MDEDSSQETFLDELFREHYGKIAGTLIRKFGPDRLDLVESAIQEAFLKAIQLWPHKGRPDLPLNWLIRVAYNFALDNLKYQKRSVALSDQIVDTRIEEPRLYFADEVTDDDLRLLFLCCHPTLAIESQVALLLKIACGFSTAEIARAFLSKEGTIAQRLVRAKRQIREEKIEFELPPAAELTQRLDAVALSLYLLFNEGYSASEGENLVREELCEKAIYLARKLVRHPLGQTPKIHALVALMLFHLARMETRTDFRGEMLLLKDQNRNLWDKRLLQEGATHLSLAMEQGELSKYHLEAGIAACHAGARNWEETDWTQILVYYELLEEVSPSPIVTLNRIAATLLSAGPEKALFELDKAAKVLADLNYYLYPAVAAEIHLQLGDEKKAKAYYSLALKLAGNKAEKNFFQKKLTQLAPEKS